MPSAAGDVEAPERARPGVEVRPVAGIPHDGEPARREPPGQGLVRLVAALAVAEQARELGSRGVVADDEHRVHVTTVLADRLQDGLGAAGVDTAPELDELRLGPAASRVLPRLTGAHGCRADDEVRHETLFAQPAARRGGVAAAACGELAIVVGLGEALLGLAVPHDDEGLVFRRTAHSSPACYAAGALSA